MVAFNVCFDHKAVLCHIHCNIQETMLHCNIGIKATVLKLKQTKLNSLRCHGQITRDS